MTRLLAPLILVWARARRRPGQWLWAVLGLVLAVGFAGAVAAEAAISGDQAARSVIGGLSPLERTVRVTWPGLVGPATSARARAVLDQLGLRFQTEVIQFAPVRLSGVVVRPAAIAPLDRWLPRRPADGLGPCRAGRCSVLLAGGGAVPARLSAAGVSFTVVGALPLRADVPLTYAPANQSQTPVVLTGDPAGLEGVRGLSGVYRTGSRLAELDTGTLHSWDLSRLERRLADAQAGFLAGGAQFAMNAPLDGLAAAHAQARAASRSLLLAGGGAIAAIALFVILSAAGLRREQLADLERLRASGANAVQLGIFVAGQALAVCAVALAAGFAVAVAVAAVLATGAGEPVGPVLTHSVLSPAAGIALAAGWLVASGVIVLSTQLRSARWLGATAATAAAALGTGLAVGGRATGVWAALLAPLCCLAAGGLIFGIAAWSLPPAERLARRGPLSGRLALVGLARAPGLPALATAFVAVSVALGGFALAYRATLDRGAGDQAADRVPLDAIVSPGPSFTTPTQLAPVASWRVVSHGDVFGVRRSEASYQGGSSTTTTVPALGVPAQALPLVHGWRISDGSAPLAELAQRLRPRGPARTPGFSLPAGADQIALTTYSPDLAVGVTADLRDQAGNVRQLALGTAGATRQVLRARVPPGRWEIEALELAEGTGLALTNAHQNGESPTPTTQFAARLQLGPLQIARRGQPAAALPLDAWVPTGGATAARPSGPGTTVRFQTSGMPGILRPSQPSDRAPVAVLADRATAAAAGPGGALELVVDGQPVHARVVGVLRRFPTLSGASGFVVADASVLASALDAQLPGQGRPDELWIRTPRAAALRAALRAAPLAQLRAAFRSDLEQAIRAAPAARATARTLAAAAAVCGLLALVGLVLVAQGPFRDRRAGEDLREQGLGPAGLRAELRTRLTLAGLLGVLPGIAIALLLERITAAAVGSASTGQAAVPPLVSVLPVAQIAAWGIGAGVLVVLTASGSARWLLSDAVSRQSRATAQAGRSEEALREGWAR